MFQNEVSWPLYSSAPPPPPLMSSLLADNTLCIAALWKMMCCQYFARANCRGSYCQYSSLPPFIAQGRIFGIPCNLAFRYLHMLVEEWCLFFQCEKYYTEVGKQTFFYSRKLQIRKFLGSFRYPKSANFFGVSVRKSALDMFTSYSQNSKISKKNAQLCLKTVSCRRNLQELCLFLTPLLFLSCFMGRVQEHVLLGHRLCRWFRFAQLAKGKKFRPY